MQKEHGLRLILAGILFATLFLPSDPEVGSNWAFITWYSVEAPLCIPFLWTLPCLGVLNACLAACSHRGLKTLYRAYLSIIFPLVLCATLIMDPFRGIGYWAYPFMVTAVALIEAILVLREKNEKKRITQ